MCKVIYLILKNYMQVKWGKNDPFVVKKFKKSQNNPKNQKTNV